MPIVTYPTLFAVLGDSENLALALAVSTHFPEDHVLIRPGQWFVVGVGTAKDISDKLGVTPGNAAGSAVIVSVNGYFGRASTPVWEWVATRVGKPSDA